MTVEIRPLGVTCNLQCQYCYQHPQRDAGNLTHRFDWEEIKAALEREGRSFTVFGGDPLMVPEEDLEMIWAWGYEKYEKNGMQTNGVLINDNHIRMFKQYNVHVGISVDGPDELNDVRWAGSLERTREATARTHAAIERLAEEDVRWSLIVTLHRNNATEDKLPRMHDWFRHIDSLNVSGVRLHILEVDNEEVRHKYALSPEENVKALLSFYSLQKELANIRIALFGDMRKMLLGDDQSVTCIWNACDSYTTRAVRGIEWDGQSSNCGRTNKDGIDFAKADMPGFERYIALYHTPQADGGCQGCRFFLMCKGQCPGTAIDGDWRNRTEYCAVWKAMYAHLEGELVNEGRTPVSARPDREKVEQAFLKAWSTGHNTNVGTLFKQAAARQARRKHGDGHGDHTDGHGDHTDAQSRRS